MKKIVSICLAIALFISCISCSSGQMVKTNNISQYTDLSSIDIGQLKTGAPIETLDLSIYTNTDQYTDSEYNYNFQEVRLSTTKEGIIQKVWVQLPGNILKIHETSVDSIIEVSNLLNSSHNEYWFDYEQFLKAHTYINKENNYTATFVYTDNHEQKLVWLILESVELVQRNIDI